MIAAPCTRRLEDALGDDRIGPRRSPHSLVKMGPSRSLVRQTERPRPERQIVPPSMEMPNARPTDRTDPCVPSDPPLAQGRTRRKRTENARAATDGCRQAGLASQVSGAARTGLAAPGTRFPLCPSRRTATHRPPEVAIPPPLAARTTQKAALVRLFARSADQNGPRATRSGPRTARSGRNAARSGASSDRFHRSAARIGPRSARFGRNTAGFGPPSARFHPCTAQIGPRSAQFP